jgi:hypothetical protein
MKQFILSIITVAMMGASVFAAGNHEVNQKARQSFQRDFSTARNISYEQKEDYVKIQFSFDDQVLYAYYNNEGELLAVIRNIVSTQLPKRLLTNLKKDFNDFWISDLFEMTSNERTTYYVTLENADGTIILKSEDIPCWTVFSRRKKAI